MTQSSNNEIPPVEGGYGPGFLHNVFGGKRFVHCVNECVKNSRDWNATRIWILTDEDPDYITFLDDGDGMGRANRNAFVSVNRTTASSPSQAGKFGTGARWFLFSHAEHVVVLTAPREEPDYVYRFQFTPDECERMALSGAKLQPERVRKTKKTWPYDHPFGTKITYKLRDPRRRSVYRGKALAEELSARLPFKFRDIVYVDGEMIPPKKIIGKLYDHVIEHPHLGQVVFELYHPEKRHHDGLLLTGCEVGEVPIKNFYRVLSDLHAFFPNIFLLDDVCGTIACSFFGEYSNEDRDSINPTIADDPRTGHFLQLLQKCADDVQRDLELRVESASVDDRHQSTMKEVASLFKKRYEPERTTVDEPTTPPEDPEEPPPPSMAPPLRLQLQREYEPGETISVKAHLRADVAKRFSIADIKWHTQRSLAKQVRTTSTGIEMTADRIGRGVIRAELPGTPINTITQYQIVPFRQFRLTPSHATIKVGDSLDIRGVNMDKVAGKLRWRIRGVGRIEEHGDRVSYSSDTKGEATLFAVDTKDSSVSSQSEIRVVPRVEETFPIRGYHFRVQSTKVVGKTEYNKPVTMVLGGRVHSMIVNVAGRGYREALDRNGATIFLAQAIAMEFSRFRRFELERPEHIDPRDLKAIFEEAQHESLEIFEEVLRTQET